MSKAKLLIRNARAVLPERVTENVDILIEDGIIKQLGICDDYAGLTIDAEGGYVFPGFVDVHIHGGGGADFMDGTVEAFESAVTAHLKHGTTTMVPTAMTASHEELVGFINAYHAFKKESPYADLVQGMHLEGPYFSKANLLSKGSQDTSLIRDIDFDEVSMLLELGKGEIIRWDAAPEIANADRFARMLTEKGIICAVAHTDAIAEEAVAGYEAGFSHVTHFYNATTAYKKRDQVVTAGVVEATYLNDDVTVELICDGKHIPHKCLLLALKIKGPDKVIGITDANRIACTDAKSGKLGSLKNGSDMIVDDGMAKLPDLTSFAGSICTMDRALKVLCVDYGVDPVTAAKMLSTNPARHIGIEGEKGSVAPGKAADLVITDSAYNVRCVVKDGRPV